MFYLFIFCLQYCVAMEQIVFNGPFMLYRDISLRQTDHFNIDVPRGKDIVFSENWFDLEENQAEGKTDAVAFISNETQKKYYCKNSLITKSARDKMLCDGVQCVSNLGCLKYIWTKILYEPGINRTSVYLFKQSINDINWNYLDDTSTQIHYYSVLRNTKIRNIAVKFPLIAWIKQNNWLSVTHTGENITSSGMSLPFTFTLKKLSWLAGKNLLGLTTSGDIITIKANGKFQAYKQGFKGRKFIDIAVDMQHPWRFVGLDANLSLIYVDFSSYKKYKNNEESSCQVSLEARKTYTVLTKLDQWPEPRSYKLWFNNNKIGLYQETFIDTGSYRTFTVHQLDDKKFMLDLNVARENIRSVNCILNSTEFF